MVKTGGRGKGRGSVGLEVVFSRVGFYTGGCLGFLKMTAVSWFIYDSAT